MSSSSKEAAGGFLWTEEGEAREGTVAEVALLLPIYPTYSFAVPAEWEGRIATGSRVVVPTGRRGRGVKGFVVGLDRRPWDSTLRPILSLVDEQSFLTPELVALGRRIARHYACPPGTTLKAMTPEAVRLKRGLKRRRFVRLIRSVEEIHAAKLDARRKALLHTLAGGGVSQAEDGSVSGVTSHEEGAVAPEPAKGASRGALGEMFLSDALKAAGVGTTIARRLADEGWIEILDRRMVEEEVEEFGGVERAEPSFELNAEQRAALADIEGTLDAGRFAVSLLFGVSGSGKTELYIRAMRRVVAAGRQALLLIPEIVLTTQLVQRLAARFDRLAVAHSGLTETQRARMWRSIAAGERAVIVGTRSAVFAPCPNLGLICVDEEQESSYKNLQAPRFHVRDVAILRAQGLGVPVVLGSATPSLEMWHHSVHRPEYRRIVVRGRANERPLPRVDVVDMTAEWLDRRRAVAFSLLMEEGLSETFAQGEQAVLLINRRGFAYGVLCPGCRTRIACPNCRVSMVLHSATGQLECHYCRYRQELPAQCPQVGCGRGLVPVGLGTQRVEEMLRRRFPQARVRRVDSDTMRHRREYEEMLRAFSAREIDCLVGTQMIAKGLDFPFVSFVGVIDADPNSLSSDFRAEERLFQLITQVAGRAGRAETAGRVVVQTTMPDLPALRCALRHDYESFAAQELAQRRRVGLPPFRRLVRFVLSHEREETARQAAEQMAERVRQGMAALHLDGADVLGPNPCPLLRLRKQYRHDLLTRTRSASDLHLLLQHLESEGALRVRGASLVVDVDPVNLQ